MLNNRFAREAIKQAATQVNQGVRDGARQFVEREVTPLKSRIDELEGRVDQSRLVSGGADLGLVLALTDDAGYERPVDNLHSALTGGDDHAVSDDPCGFGLVHGLNLARRNTVVYTWVQRSLTPPPRVAETGPRGVMEVRGA